MSKPSDDQAAAPAAELLRKQAQAIAAHSPEALEAQLPQEYRELLHELRVHQIELELQNEHLRESQVALETARARYYDLYDLAPVGYCTVDDSGVIQECNLTLAMLLGVPRSGLVGQAFQRSIDSDAQDSFYLCSNRLFKKGEPQSLELRMLSGDGAKFWAQLNITAAPDTDGKTRLRIVISDISERKRVEESLRKQKEYSHLIAENIADFIAVLDPEGRRLYNSPSYAKFLGNPRNLIGSDSFVDVHPEDRERVKAAFRETVASGTGRQLEYRLLVADGGIRNFESHGSAIKDSAGRTTRVLVVSHDITERKQAEMALQASETRFRNLLQSIPSVAVQGYGEDGTTCYWNKASEMLYGYTAEEAIGRNLLDLIIPPEMRSDVRSAIRQMFATGQPIPAGEHSLLRSDGSRVEVLSSHAYVHVPGQAPEMFCVDVDLSELKRAEYALRLTRTSVEAASDAMFWVDPDARIVDVNEAACRSLGYSRAELLRLKIGDLDPSFDAAFWPVHFAELREKKSLSFETKNHRKDGSSFPVEVVTNYVRFGGEERGCAVVRDISERKLAERKLAESEQRFSLFMDHLPVAAFIKEESGRVLFLNRYLANLLGDPDWRGKTTGELFPPEIAETMVADDRRAMASGCQLAEEQVNGPDGRPRFYQTHKFRIPREGSPALLGGIAVDITERKLLEDQIRHLAFYDPLTNLPNRRLLFERLGQALAAKRRSGANIALMLIDIDHFKSINDTHGHDAGDFLLGEVARRVSGCVRGTDTVARLGGDELVAVLGELDREQEVAAEEARHVAEKIRDTVCHAEMLLPRDSGAGSIPLQCTVSIGVAFLVDRESWQLGVFRQADTAMYEAKAAGRNTIRFFAGDSPSAGAKAQTAR